MKKIANRLKESAISILPIVSVVLLLNLIFPQIKLENDSSLFGPVMTSLLLSSIPLILGTALFSLGADKSVAKIGEVVGKTLSKRKTLTMLLIIALLMGFLVTIAEPDLTILASRISPSGPDWLLILAAACGVAIFLLISILRVIYNKPLKYWLVIGYGLVFTLGLLSDKSFFSIVFDAGGVTTGVITVPFILAISMSVARVLGGKNSEDASFGYSGLCSLGTVLFVMIFSIIIKNSGRLDSIQEIIELKFLGSSPTDSMMVSIDLYSKMGSLFIVNLLSALKDVAISMIPIIIFFIAFNFYAKIKGKELGGIVIGFIYTFIGMVLFFLGATSGFIPVASLLGRSFASFSPSQSLLMLVIVFILGFISMLAEPSVKILASNVQEVSRGVITNKAIIISLGFATGIALLLNSLRVMFDIQYIYFIIPLFLIALALSFFSPEIYIGISIDAAGVATGTMASCFFLPLFISYTASDINADGISVMTNGFGVVGIMSVLPIITIEFMGILASCKIKLAYKKALSSVLEEDDNQVIHLPSQLQEEVI